MLALTTAVLVLAAPPPKPADKTGRITLWVGDKVVSFLPDGTDRTTTTTSDAKNPIGIVFCFTPHRKLAVNIISPTDFRNAKIKSDSKLVIDSLDDGGKRYTLNGYV